MGLFTGQANVPTGGTIVCVVPPGPGEVVLSNGGTAVTYVGVGATVTTTGGVPIPSGGVLTFNLYQGSGGGTLRALTAGGSAALGFLVTTSYGLAQPGTQ